MDGNFISKDALCQKIHTGMNIIEAMQAIVDEPTVELPRWISVEERLPEESAFVLCSLTGRYKNVAYESAYVIGTYYADEGWILEEAPRWENPPVTHWMELPEPPEIREEQSA